MNGRNHQEATNRSTQPVGGNARFSTHLPGLDGLRGLAVAVVVAYHLGFARARGGFLGVDVFFVVSGFLVTMLLSAELSKRGRVDLKNFWVRRVRRLMPALFALLGTCGVVYGFRVREKLAAGRLDLAAGTVYFSNWRMILSSTSYFDQLGRPPLTRHLWSLAIEGQFYLLWPVLLGAFAVVCQLDRVRMAVLTLILGFISLAWGALLFDPATDPSRVYFGTDTRLVAVLFGAALALVLTPNGTLKVPSPRVHRALSSAGVLALVGLGIAVSLVGDQWSWLYRGGFGVVALVSAITVWSAASQGTVLARLLSLKPLTVLGVRSYSLYLWHWPVIAMTQPGLDVPITMNRWVLVGLRLAISAVLTELSYRLIEVPFRQRLLVRWVASLAGRPDGLRRNRGWYAGTFSGVLLVTGTAAGVSRAALNDGIADSLRNPNDVLAVSGSGVPVSLPVVLATVPPEPVTTFPLPPPDPALTTTTVASTVAAPAGAPTPLPEAAGPLTPKSKAITTTTLPRPPGVLAIGDSVMKGAATALATRLGEGSVIDAAVSRQFSVGIKILKQQRSKGLTFGALVIHLGNNGVPTKKQFQALLDEIGSSTPVLFVTMRESREWAPKLNELLREQAKSNANMRVLEWSKAANQYEYLFAKDRLHLTVTGGVFYSDLIVWGLRQAGYLGTATPSTLAPATSLTPSVEPTSVASTSPLTRVPAIANTVATVATVAPASVASTSSSVVDTATTTTTTTIPPTSTSETPAA